MRAIEFRRVSTQEQGNDNRLGLPRQREQNAFTIQKHKLSVIKTIELIDVSGTAVLHTPEMKELLKLIESEEINGVVVADLDRLFRPDYLEDFKLLDVFRRTGTLIFLPDQVIDMNTQSGRLLGGIFSIISGNELIQIKKRMLEAKELKRKEGKHPNNLNSLPLGVTYDYEKGCYYYTEGIEKVKKLFCLFYYEGIQNYRALERLTGICHRTISNLLRNKMYIGIREYKEKRSSETNMKPDGRQGDKKKVKRIGNDAFEVRVIDEPAIPEDVFYRVQKIIGNKRKEYHTKKITSKSRFLYSGFLKCGVCSEKMYHTSGGKNPNKDRYYCRTKNDYYTTKNGPSQCSSKFLSREVVDETITSFVGEKLTEKKYLRHLIRLAFSDNRNQEIQSELEQIGAEIQKANKKRERFLELYGEGLYSREELDSKIMQLNEAIANHTAHMDMLKGSRDLIEKPNTNEIVKDIVFAVSEFEYWNSEQKREFLRSQIPEFFFSEDGITRCTLAFRKLGNLSGTDSWRLQTARVPETRQRHRSEPR